MRLRKPSFLAAALASFGLGGFATNSTGTSFPQGQMPTSAIPCVPRFGRKSARKGGGKKGGGKKCQVRPVAMGSHLLVGARRARRQAKLFRKTALLSYED